MYLINTVTKFANLLFQVFVYVSTAYCNCDRPVIEEVVYPPHADWKDMISIAERCDEHTLNILTPKYVTFYN
jgi:fatty acyl-CoA reductase